jgi:DUF438 domain-containing protein
MTITPKTTVHTLLKEHPFLLEYLIGYHAEFQKLANPIMRKAMTRIATIDHIASTANVPLNQLMIDLQAEVARVTGSKPEIRDEPSFAGADEARQDVLKSIIRDLHAGVPMEQLKERFAALIEDVGAGEIGAMEQQLIAEGMPEKEVRRLCDVHVEVFADALDGHEAVKVPAGHPIDSLQRENQAFLQVTATLRKVTDTVGDPPDMAQWARLKEGFTTSMERLFQIHTHYLRKENQLFPYLEKHGIEGPPKVMWAIHDDVRTVVKEGRAALGGGDTAAALSAARQLTTMVDDMIYKEEKILFPMSLEALSEADWIAARQGEAEIGYALIGAPPAWPPQAAATAGAPAAPAAGEPAAPAAGEPAVGADLLMLDTGALTLAQADLMLGALPLDFSFVDEDDRVRYYSEGDRIFPRSPGVIGRKVQNCHPPESVHKVQAIIDAFRTGEKETAEFWLTIAGRFLHIRYFAVRDAKSTYKGVVETVQDVTAIRALEGQRRLLDW